MDMTTGHDHDDLRRQAALDLAEWTWGAATRPLTRAMCAIGADPKAMSVEPGQWWAVQVQPGAERAAHSGIAEAGMPVYRPLMPRREAHGRGRVRIALRSMFPGYLFARAELDEDHWHRIAATRGVVRILGARGVPRPIADDAIMAIRLVEAEASRPERRAQVVWHFAAGDVARIKSGPFAGLVARLQSAVDERDRIGALIDILGRETSVDLPADDLEAL